MADRTGLGADRGNAADRRRPASAACAADSDCDLDRRVALADAYLAERPGTVGYVLRDRQTGYVHRNAHAADPVWTASTIKLAMVDDLLVRNRSGAIALTAADRQLMAAMLHSSDDTAADTLWSRYGAPTTGPSTPISPCWA